jgi:hypothetical protein
MDASAGLIITAVLAGLLCLRRRRCADPVVRREQNEVLMHMEVERRERA